MALGWLKVTDDLGTQWLDLDEVVALDIPQENDDGTITLAVLLRGGGKLHFCFDRTRSTLAAKRLETALIGDRSFLFELDLEPEDESEQTS
jgi:hypothetical protein